MELLRVKRNRIYLRAESMNDVAILLLHALGTRYDNYVYSITIGQFIRWDLVDFINS